MTPANKAREVFERWWCDQAGDWKVNQDRYQVARAAWQARGEHNLAVFEKLRQEILEATDIADEERSASDALRDALLTRPHRELEDRSYCFCVGTLAEEHAELGHMPSCVAARTALAMSGNETAEQAALAAPQGGADVELSDAIRNVTEFQIGPEPDDTVPAREFPFASHIDFVGGKKDEGLHFDGEPEPPSPAVPLPASLTEEERKELIDDVCTCDVMNGYYCGHGRVVERIERILATRLVQAEREKQAAVAAAIEQAAQVCDARAEMYDKYQCDCHGYHRAAEHDAEEIRALATQPQRDALAAHDAALVKPLVEALVRTENAAMAILRRDPVRDLDEITEHNRILIARYKEQG